MERMRYIFFFMIGLLFLMPLGFAATVLIQTTNDTYVNTTDVHGAEGNISLGQNKTVINVNSYVKFNMSTQQYIITNITYNVHREAGFNGNTFVFRLLDNQTWDEAFLNYTSEPVQTPNTNLTSYYFNSANDNFVIPFNLTPTTLYYFYDLPTVTIFTNTTQHSPDSNTQEYRLSSKENGNTSRIPTLNITGIIYQSGYVQTIDNDEIWFDFDSGTYQNSSFTGADFIYDINNNIIYPIALKSEISLNPIIDLDNTTNTSLGTLTCSATGVNIFGGYTGTQRININNGILDSPPKYDQYCFDLSGSHNGNAFYGAIKIINNQDFSGTSCTFPNCYDLRFYWAEYSPAFNTFSLPSLEPNPAREGLNETISWATTNDLSTRLRYRYNNSGEMSPWQFVEDYSTYSQGHAATINNQNIHPYNYEFYLEGNDTNNNNYTSIMYNFSVVASPTSRNATSNATVYGSNGALQRLTDTGFCSDVTICGFIFGTIILGIGGFFAFYAGGMRLGLAVIITIVIMEAAIGLLPIFLLTPIIVLSALVIVIMFRKTFGSGNPT